VGDQRAGRRARLITFAGPLGTADGPRECRRGIEALSEMIDRAEVVTIVADGRDVITWFELHAPGPIPSRSPTGHRSPTAGSGACA
jgi:hypothetical protein